jgi:hypothetical protein
VHADYPVLEWSRDRVAPYVDVQNLMDVYSKEDGSAMEHLGSGAFGQVFRAKIGSNDFAIKAKADVVRP